MIMNKRCLTAAAIENSVYLIKNEEKSIEEIKQRPMAQSIERVGQEKNSEEETK